MAGGAQVVSVIRFLAIMVALLLIVGTLSGIGSVELSIWLAVVAVGIAVILRPRESR
jgi:hypothetical protein